MASFALPFRTLIVFAVSALLLCAPTASAAGQNGSPDAASLKGIKISAAFAYVGGFSASASKERRGAAKGIEVVRIEADGRWTGIQTMEAHSPGWLAMDGKKRFLYSSQGDGFDVTAYAIDAKSGTLSKLNVKQSSGRNGVHLVVSPDDRFLIVVNFADGCVDSFALNPDGSLGDRVCTVSTKGDLGPLKVQTKSTPHYAAFSKDGRYVMVPDRGRDLVHVFNYDPDAGMLTAHEPAGMISRLTGLGTRWFDWHPTRPFAYVLEESADAITVASWDAKKGVLTPVQWVPSVPDTIFHLGGINPLKAPSNGSSILRLAKSGKFVYVTNRSDHSIGCWAIDQNSGRLTSRGWVKVGGVLPRDFAFDPSYSAIFVANQLSSNITALKVNQQSGALTFVGEVFRTGAPTCIVFK